MDRAQWQHVRDRLLNEIGRARVHDLRGHLNVVSLNLELLTTSPVAGRGEAGTAQRRAAESMRREVSEAGGVLTGLHALILEMTSPATRTLPDAADWALAASAPVAARRAIALSASAPLTDLPERPGPAGLSLALALVLVEACLASPRRGSCVVDLLPGRCGIDISWAVDGSRSREPGEAAVGALGDLLRGSGEVETRVEQHRQHVVMALHAPDRGGSGTDSLTGRTFGA